MKTGTSSKTQEFAKTCSTDPSWNDGWNGDEWNDGWSFDEWNDGWSSVGWHEGWEQTYDTSAISFSLGGLDVSATSSPKRFEWVKMNLDTGAAGNTFPLNFGSERAGDGRFYRTDSGEWIPIHSKIGQGMKIHMEKLVNWHGQNKVIPVYLENNMFNFYLNREVKSTETNNVNDADHCLAKNCQQLGNGDGRAVRW